MKAFALALLLMAAGSGQAASQPAEASTGALTAAATPRPTFTATAAPSPACNYFKLTPVPSIGHGAPYGLSPQPWEQIPSKDSWIETSGEASILADPDDKAAPYKMAFCAADDFIGTATSQDGLHWKKRADNPIYNGRKQGTGHAGRICLIKWEGLYYIYFSDWALEYRISTANFKGAWSFNSTPVIASGSVPDDSGAENCSIYIDPSTGIWWMLWEHLCNIPHPNSTFQIELMQSTDNGLTFHRDATAPHPLTSLDPGGCGKQANAPSRLYRDAKGCFYMLYTTNLDCAGFGDIYWAKSCDTMRTWSISSGPVIVHNANCLGIAGCDQAGDPEWVQGADGNTYIYYAIANNAHGGGTGGMVYYPGPACRFFACSDSEAVCEPPAPKARQR